MHHRTIKSYTYYFKRYINIGLPMLLTSLSPIFIAIADNVMVGYLGEEVRAAASFSNIITGIPLLLLIGISSVLMPLVASAVVYNNYDKATKILKYSIFVSLCCSITCIIILSFMTFFLDKMGQDERVVTLAKSGYYQIIIASILLNSISQPLRRYLDGLGFSFWNTGFSFLGAMVNICGNYLLIQGNHGFPALGLIGAGISTFLSRLLILIIYLIIIGHFRKKGYVTSFRFGTWDQPYFIKMLKLSLPSGFELAIKIFYLTLINIMIGWMGIMEQSSASILFAMIRIGLLLPVAISTAGSILLAEEWKKGNKEAIGKIRHSAYLLNILLAFALGLSFLKLFPFILENVFKPAEEVKILVHSLIPMVLLFQIIDGFTFIGTGLLRGIRDTFVPFLITTFVSFLVGYPLSYFLAFSLGRGLLGIFQGVITGLLLVSLLLYVRFNYKIKVLIGNEPKNKVFKDY